MAIAKQAYNAQQSKVIIQCPECQTKFAVESSHLKELDLPRFHCSRCDHVFSLDPNAIAEDHINPPAPARDTDPLFSGDPLRQSDPRSGADEPAQRKEPPTRSIQIPRYDKPISASAPHESDTLGFGADQMTFDFGAQQKSRGRAAADTWDFPATAPSPLKNDIAPRQEDQSDKQPTFVRPAWRNVAWLLTPVLMCLMALAYVSFSLVKNPRDGLALTMTGGNSALHAAPAGVAIEGLSYEAVALDDGETVHLISGRVKNNSLETLREVLVEGILFDGVGALVDRSTVNIGSTLAKTRVKSLNMEMIANLQSGKLAKKFELRPGQSHEFTFAQLGAAPSFKPAYFSARIHSVKIK